MTVPNFSLSYAEVASAYYPDSEFVAYGTTYSDIVWTSPAIPEADVTAKYLELLKIRYIEWVKDEATKLREEASYRVIGTDVPSMIRIYDIKKVQAKDFMERFDAGATPETATYSTMSSALSQADQDILKDRYPLVFEEAEGTSLTLWQQCWAILDQFRLAAIVLEPILGQLEAVRRNKIQEYLLAPDIASVLAITEPVWSDIDLLQEI